MYDLSYLVKLEIGSVFSLILDTGNFNNSYCLNCNGTGKIVIMMATVAVVTSGSQWIATRATMV